MVKIGLLTSNWVKQLNLYYFKNFFVAYLNMSEPYTCSSLKIVMTPGNFRLLCRVIFISSFKGHNTKLSVKRRKHYFELRMPTLGWVGTNR